ncbi:hypothetical protein Pfo_001074 [Paulownia fortunei]|nr:hypothetical protein Pfo_001074 [Paulownia fortunei]
MGCYLFLSRLPTKMIIADSHVLFFFFKNIFRTSDMRNKFNTSFSLCIFDLFDVKRNGHIDFGELMRSLSIFQPRTPEAEKVACAFKLYDLRHTGYIEREDLKEMVLALLNESDLSLSNDIVETIVDKTFKEADINGDGKIDQEERKEYAAKNPLLLRNMTLPYLMDITLAFPSFLMHTEAEDSKLAGGVGGWGMGGERTKGNFMSISKHKEIQEEGGQKYTL